MRPSVNSTSQLAAIRVRIRMKLTVGVAAMMTMMTVAVSRQGVMVRAVAGRGHLGRPRRS
jgi:hypothetical protein